MKKIIALLICAASLLGLAAGCGNNNSPASGNGDAKWLNVVMTEDPDTLDVQKTTVYYDVPLNIYNCLVECKTVDGEPQLLPCLAEKWDISDDGLVYTFHLREGVKFHIG